MAWDPQWRDRVLWNDAEWMIWLVRHPYLDLVATGVWDVTQAETVHITQVRFLYRPPGQSGAGSPKPPRKKEAGPSAHPTPRRPQRIPTSPTVTGQSRMPPLCNDAQQPPSHH